MKKLYILAATAIAVAACAQTQDSALKEKVESYAVVEVTSPLYDALSENDKKIVGLFREAGEIIDGLFWKQTFGNKAEMEALTDEYAKAYATRLLAIDVNLKIDEMLDTAWELFGTYFTKAETGIKQEFIDTYWKGN